MKLVVLACLFVKTFHSLVVRRVKAENPLFILAVEGVINSKILKNFVKLLF